MTRSLTLDTAVTWLFVPGDRPDRFAKATAAGADAVILDLEDAVGEDDKAGARDSVTKWLGSDQQAWVRVNAVNTPWHDDDIAGLAAARGLAGVILPKAENVREIGSVRRRLRPDVSLIALIESAAGVLSAPQIARAGDVDRLAFGSIDFALDINAEDDFETLLLARQSLVIASRAGGLPPPLDGVTMVIDDSETLSDSASRGRKLGFGGKLCIHPSQVVPVRSAFLPTQTEVRRATELVAEVNRRSAAGLDAGAFRYRGAMVDRPVLARAQAVLRLTDTSQAKVGGNE